MVFLSIGARILVDVEALNMVESIGNVSRHRRVSMVMPKEGKYVKVEAPAISGPTIAHGYQELLVETSRRIYEKPPVCKYCAMGEFFKSTDKAHIMDSAKEVMSNKKLKEIDRIKRFEEEVIKGCIVEDVGGFLYTEAPPVKRTSRFYVGYMVPAFDTFESTSLDMQLHVRHTPSEPSRREGEGRTTQMIYYLESGSALYTFQFALDLDGIGYTSMVERRLVLPEEERDRRVRVALSSLIPLLLDGRFGAKRSRYLPLWEVRSVFAALSDPVPFMPLPPSRKEFITKSLEKGKNFVDSMKGLGIGEGVRIYLWSDEVEMEGIEEAGEKVQKFENLSDLMKKLVEDALSESKKVVQ
ncbi:MAG: type I-A CRISPR-associated protein Cas7/Csa2 [Candidatus Asgardarchaeia archaeon]